LLEQIVFTNGESLPRHALFLRPKQQQHSALLTKLGVVKVNANGETGIPHLYLAGDAANPLQHISLAIAGGVCATLTINQNLLQEILSFKAFHEYFCAP